MYLPSLPPSLPPSPPPPLAVASPVTQRHPPPLSAAPAPSSPLQPRPPPPSSQERTPPPRSRPRLASTGHALPHDPPRPLTSSLRPSSVTVRSRPRLGSDSSARVSRGSSLLSIEKADIPDSPPSSPPPPYSEVDSNPAPQAVTDVGTGSGYAAMHRTRSHGHVSSPAYLVRARATVQQLPDPMRRRRGSSSSGGRDTSQSGADLYSLGPANAQTGGTLV